MNTLTFEAFFQQFDIDYFRELSTFGALSEQAVISLLQQGEIQQFEKGETMDAVNQALDHFFIILTGDMAYYQHCEGRDVLTRHFLPGEQMGFDVMIGMRTYSGIIVAGERSIFLKVSSDQFFQFHVDHAMDFGLLMINLSRELSREIDMLENALGQSTGWESLQQ